MQTELACPIHTGNPLRTDEQSLVPDPTDETARSGIDLEDIIKGKDKEE
jgi:hypothetical protein